MAEQSARAQKLGKGKRRRGRPSKYNEAIAKIICERLAGGETLRAICKDKTLPSERTVRTWAMDLDHPFSPQYARAREIGYMKMADDILEIADDASEDYQRSRLRVDTRKWLLSKALPKIFGNKVRSEIAGKDGGPIEIDDVSEPVDDLELARLIAFVLTRAAEIEGDQQFKAIDLSSETAADTGKSATPQYRKNEK